MKNSKRPISDLDPMLIQSWFDGELDETDLEEINTNDVMSHPMYGALSELRDVVRTDVESAFDDVNEDAMWAAISRGIADIDVKTGLSKEETTLASAAPHTSKSLSIPSISTPSRSVAAPSSRKNTILRWLPSIIGAALFLVSIPGLYTMLAPKASEPAQQPTTVVYVEAAAATPMAPNSVTYAAHKTDSWQSPGDEQTSISKSRIIVPTQTRENQLTVEEMDTAIKLLMNRLETLEEENRQRIERGDAPLRPSI